MKTDFWVAILLSLSFCSCLRTIPDEELTMIRTPYNGTDMKINGWYKGDKILNNRCEYLFFYMDGVCLEFVDFQNIENINQFTRGIDSFRKSKLSWNLFQVENKQIHIQGWRSNLAAIQLVASNWTYKIINDTTLISDSTYGDVRYYHFKPFNPKPDSTNVFIK